MACGGGGGGTTAPPPPPAPPPPAFALSSVSPADAATGVARDVVISATFNSALDEVSATSAGTFSVAGPGNNLIPATLTVKAGGTVEIRPTAGALPGDTRYTLSVGKALKDSTGRTLGLDVSRSFSTASVRWAASAETVATLSRFDTDGSPAALTDAAGRTTVAWLAPDGPAVTLTAARLASINGSWGSPAVLETAASGTRLSVARLAAGPAGDVFLTWTRTAAGGVSQARWARFSLARASWSTPDSIPTAPASADALPISDAAGNLVLLCHDGASLRATRLSAASGTWSPAQALERPFPGNSILPNLTRAVADSRGNLVAAWMQLDEDGRAIYAARFDASTSAWSAAQRVDSVPFNGSDAFQLGVDGADVVTLAWTRSGGVAGGDTVWASRLDAAGRAWLSPVRVDRTDPAVSSAQAVSLAVDRAGTATALWQQGGLRMARWAAGAAAWTEPTPVVTGERALPGVASLQVDAAGNLIVLAGALGQEVLASRYLISTGQWQPAVVISAPPSGTALFTTQPVATVDGAGQVIALWLAQNRVGSVDEFPLSFNRLR